MTACLDTVVLVEYANVQVVAVCQDERAVTRERAFPRFRYDNILDHGLMLKIQCILPWSLSR